MNTFRDRPTDGQDTQMDPEQEVRQARRNFLKIAGRFAVYTPPTVMMLMKPGYARMNHSVVGRARGNNGIGNGLDEQPPGNPKPNDMLGVHKGNRPYVEDR